MRHLPAHTDRPVTVFRCQFYTGFVKLFKLEASGADLDGVKPPCSVRLLCEFQPASGEIRQMEDAYEILITKESSALWSEVLRRKETRMMNSENKDGRCEEGHEVKMPLLWGLHDLPND